MPRIAPKPPKNDAELFDLIHTYFGVGDWDADLDGSVRPWHKVRMAEIAKLKAIRKKRRFTLPDFTMLVEFCHRQRLPVRTTFALLEHWPDAVRDRAANARSQLDVEVERALEIERHRPDGAEWVERFLRAQGGGRVALLQRWREERDV